MFTSEKSSHIPSPVRRWGFFDRDHAWLLTGIALALRLAFFLYILFVFGDAGFILAPFTDGNGYVTIATNVLHGRGFSLDTSVPFTPDIKRVPFYPLYLAGTFALSGGAWWLASLLQTFMGAAIVYILYRLTASLAGTRAGFFAALFAAVYPFAIFISTQLLAETLFTLVLFGAFALILRALVSPSVRRIMLSGMLLGLATLVKPAAQYIVFLCTPFVVFSGRSIMRFVYPIVFLLCFAAIISPWIARNYYATGHAMISFEADILFDLHAAGYMAFKETGEASRAPEYRSVQSESESLATPRSVFVKRILVISTSDPIGFAEYLAITTVPFVFGDGFVTMVAALSPDHTLPPWNFSTSLSSLGHTLGFGVAPSWLVVLSLANKCLWALVLCSAALGFIRMIRDGGSCRQIALLIMLVISYFMFAGGPVQSARYRAPVEPLIFLMAGVGIATVMRLYEIREAKHNALSSRSH